METKRGALLKAVVSLAALIWGLSGSGAGVAAEVGDNGGVLHLLQGSSLRLDPPSPTQVPIGAWVTASGSLLELDIPLAGQPVIVTFVSPSGDVQQKVTVTDTTGTFHCDYLPTLTGDWTVKARYEGTTNHNSAVAEPQGFDVTPAETFLTGDLSAVSIVTGTSLSVKGALKTKNPLDPGTKILSGRLLTLTLYDSFGTVVDSMTAVTTETGAYLFALVSLPQDGKWTMRVQFSGDANLDPCSTGLLTARARPSAGYAIIVAGKVSGGTGLESHNKTTDRAYRRFKKRGFTDENIMYFRYGAPTDSGTVVDGTPRQEPDATANIGIREAIVTWAKNKMNSSNGPLYILFVNHGNTDKFYVDPSAPSFEDRIIDPVELDTWISQLEGSLVGDAAEEEIVFIYGACYSGSFIPTLSNKGRKRIIITSADPYEQSFKGPMEADGVRDGEFFVTQLFTALASGVNLKRGFEAATEITEAYTSNTSGNGGVSPTLYADDAAQHPLLDDNEDGVGSNDALSTYPGNDGAVSATLILGYQYTTGENARFTSVSPAKYLSPGDHDPVIEAQVGQSENVSEIWVAIKPPAFDMGKPLWGTSEQREVVAPSLEFDSQPQAGTFQLYNFDKGGFSGFDAPGRYQILYFVKDLETGDITSVKRSFVYRNTDPEDDPPGGFDLTQPSPGSIQNTFLFLDWRDSVDPEGDLVTYTVQISTDPTFADPGLVIEGIDGSSLMIDESDGLNDLTVYFWRVIAVDSQGNRTFSSQTLSFSTNNTNAWGNYNVLTAIVRNFNDPSTWPPGPSIEIQPYVGTVYNHYFCAMVPLGPYSVDSEAPQFSHEHDNVQVIEESPTTVLQLPEPNSGAASGTVEDSGTSSPVRGATVRLEVTSGIYAGTRFSTCSGDDGGFQIGSLFGAVDYKITVEKNFYTSCQDTFSLAAGENRNLGIFQIGFQDADSDGLPDGFEQAIVNADPDDEIDDIWDVLGTDDFDGDGLTNEEECAASTDPTSPGSFLRITSVAKQSASVEIIWASEPGVYYEVYYTDDLLGWTKAAGPIPSSDTGSTSWTDDGSTTTPPPSEARKRFYRVQVY
jgi:hypothetical protein